MPGTTPIYGFPYPEPTDLVADYPALGQQLAEDIEAVLPDFGGLIASPPTTIANSGGTATLTGNTVTFTTVTSVSLNGCFTGDYDNYRVLVNISTTSTTNATSCRLRVGGVDASASNYNQYGMSADTSAVSLNSGTGNTLFTVSTNSSTNGAVAALEFMRPALAVHTGIFVNTSNWNTGAYGTGIILHQVNTAYNGFTLTASTGSISGAVRVYGYKK